MYNPTNLIQTRNKYMPTNLINPKYINKNVPYGHFDASY